MKTDSRSRGRFDKVHVCPLHPEEAEEGSAVALVVLHPTMPHDQRADVSAAMIAAEDATKRRSGGRLRMARNTLIFVAAEAGALAEARKTAKLLLAWRSIRDDKALDLKDSQRLDATTQATQSQLALESSVRRAWSQVLVPVAPRSDDGEPFDLDRIGLRNTGAKSVALAVWDRIRGDDLVQETLGRMTLSDRLKENWPAGVASLPVASIRDWFTQFVRFERLRDETVLAEALSTLLGDAFGEFAYADAATPEGGYRGIAIGKDVTVRFDGAGLLLRREEAEAQIEATRPRVTAAPDDPAGPSLPTGPRSPGDLAEPTPAPRALRRFYGSVELDPNRPVRDLQPIIDSVISELLRADGAKLTLRLEIEATAPGGFKADDAAVVRDNARTLKFRPEATGFSEE